MVLVDYLMGIPSPKLNVPDRFEVGLYSSHLFYICKCLPLWEAKVYFFLVFQKETIIQILGPPPLLIYLSFLVELK